MSVLDDSAFELAEMMLCKALYGRKLDKEDLDAVGKSLGNLKIYEDTSMIFTFQIRLMEKGLRCEVGHLPLHVVTGDRERETNEALKRSGLMILLRTLVEALHAFNEGNNVEGGHVH